MSTEKIKLVKVGRKQQPSKYKPGETYAITTVLDDKNRKLSAMGKWSENWKVGDEIEVTIEEKKWTDRDGFEQTNLALKNPNQTSFNRSFAPKNVLIDAYHIAAELAPVVYKAKTKITMKDIDELAKYLKEKLELTLEQPKTAPANENVPTVDVNKPAETSTTEDNDLEIDDADDGKPF